MVQLVERAGQLHQQVVVARALGTGCAHLLKLLLKLDADLTLYQQSESDMCLEHICVALQD